MTEKGEKREDVEAFPKSSADNNSSITSNKDSLDENKGEAGLEALVNSQFNKFVFLLEGELKPYFEHVDTRSFLRRCFRSVIPETKYDELLSSPDFYGPLILTFTLTSIVHFAFKDADPSPLDRHLGTSILLCFGSLIVGSLLLSVAWQYLATMARSGPAKYGLDRAVCIVGYSFFGPCILFLLDGRLWKVLFYPAAMFLEFGTVLSVGVAVFSANQNKNHVLAVGSALIHVLWLYSLRSTLYAIAQPLLPN